MAHVHPRRPSRRALTAATAAGLLLAGLGAAPAVAAPTKAELREKIAKQSATLKKVSEDYNEAREQLTANEKKIKDIRQRMPELEKQVTGAKADFAKVAASTYKISNLHEASAILSQPGPDNMMRRLGAIDQLTQRRQAKVTDLTTVTHTYAADQQRLAAEVARQEIQVRDLGKRKASIQADLDKFYALRRQVYGSKDSGGGSYTGAIPKVSGQAGAVVRFAYQAIGKPYRFGADGPDGYDCSGLTSAAWRKAGKSLPHNARMQWNNVARLERGGLAAGDLVFYTDLSHVGIYVGGGKVIHAPTFGEKVKISPIGMMSIYGYGRPR